MNIEYYKPEFTTLQIGDGGIYASAPNKYSHIYTAITIYDKRLSAYYGDLVEGGVVIDKRPCLDKGDFIKMVVGGPMLGEHLSPGHKCSLFEQPRSVNKEDNFSSMDYISLDIYLYLWKKLEAKIGYRQGNMIKWESGKNSIIPKAKDRYNKED